MAATTQHSSLEDRLTAVEQALAEIQQRLSQVDSCSNWLERMTGSMQDFPEFDEVVRLGREFRQQDRPPDLDEEER